MEMILTNVALLSEDWRAWLVAALVVAKAAQSIYFCLRCPVMRGAAEITDEMTELGKNYQFRPPFSFLIMMVGGMALAVVGLYMLHDSKFGPLALGAMVVGVFLFLTQPARLFVRASTMEVFATADAGVEGEANILARDRLRAAHRERAMFEIVIAAAVLAILYFF